MSATPVKNIQSFHTFSINICNQQLSMYEIVGGKKGKRKESVTYIFKNQGGGS